MGGPARAVRWATSRRDFPTKGLNGRCFGNIWNYFACPMCSASTVAGEFLIQGSTQGVDALEAPR